VSKFSKFLMVAILALCNLAAKADESSVFAERSIEIFQDAALEIIDSSQAIEIRGQGYRWAEGPVWVDEGGYLLFSDIPNNVIYRYNHAAAPTSEPELYLERSGATNLYEGDYQAGSNGLLLNQYNQLVLLQQGDRRVAVMDAPLDKPQTNFVTLASHYSDKRLNSPNDAVFDKSGNLYFTDPPYGLDQIMEDQRKELDFQGVYYLSADGALSLLDGELSFPNGVSLSADQQTLYVAVSDPIKPIWFAYSIIGQGKVVNKRVFYDASDLVELAGEQGLPDGMVVHSSGNIFATGPGGVWLFSPQGEVLAKIRTGRLTANCTLSDDEKTLFITAHDTLMTVALK
jgi:gluconolactonase